MEPTLIRRIILRINICFHCVIGCWYLVYMTPVYNFRRFLPCFSIVAAFFLFCCTFHTTASSCVKPTTINVFLILINDLVFFIMWQKKEKHQVVTNKNPLVLETKGRQVECVTHCCVCELFVMNRGLGHKIETLAGSTLDSNGGREAHKLGNVLFGHFGPLWNCQNSSRASCVASDFKYTRQNPEFQKYLLHPQSLCQDFKSLQTIKSNRF